MIPEAAVEAAARVTFEGLFDLDPDDGWEYLTPAEREPYERQARAALEAAAPFIQAQALRDAVEAFPLETITAPDNAVVWMMRRAQEIRPTP